MSLKLFKKVDFSSDILVFTLFGIYSLTLAPYLTKSLIFGEKNYVVGILGFLIYILEIFAFKFKMYMIRLRAEEIRIQIKQTTGEDKIIPRTGGVAWMGVFFRIVVRIGILFLTLHAFGISDNSSGADSAALIIIMASILEFCLTVYLVLGSGLFNPEITYKWEAANEIDRSNEWVGKEMNAEKANFNSAKELLSDIILNVYAFMVFTGLWDQINATAIKMLENSFELHEDALAAGVNVFSMLLILIMFALPTLRLVYWIEGYALSFADKDRWRTRGAFLIAAIITIAPTISYFYNLYFPR